MNEIRSVSVMVDIARSYLFAKQQLLAMGFGHEIVESYDSKLADLTETTLLQETAWVILSAGMAERTVRGKFTDITASFLGWCSAREIAANATICYSSALLHFNHPGKIGVIAKMAAVIDSETFPSVREA